MAGKQVIRELVTLWGFDIDQQPLKEVDAGINVIKSSLKGLAVSLASSAVAVGFLLNEAGEDEQTRIAFETMLGSAEAMEDKLRELEAFAVRTPFTLKGIKQNSKLLLGMGIEAEKLLPTMKFLGDVSAGLSVPLERLALNYGQVRNQNKLTGRELRDFAVAGVPLLDVLAKNLGKTTKEISSMISKGQISFGDVEKAFESMTSGSGRFADLMTKQSKSLFGLLSNVKDIIQLLARDLGNELLPEAKRIVSEFMNLITVNRELIQQNLGEFIRNTASFMGGLFDMTMTLFRAMTGLVKVFGGWNTVLKISGDLIMFILGTGLVLGIGLVTKALGGMILAWGAHLVTLALNAKALMALGGGILPSVSLAFKSMGTAALWAQAKMALIPLAIGAIAVAIALIAEDIFAFSEGRDSVFGRMVSGMDTAFEVLTEKFGFFGNFLKVFLAGILTPVRMIVNGFRSIGTVIDIIRGKKGIMDGLGDIGAQTLNSFDVFGAANKGSAASFGFGGGVQPDIEGQINANSQPRIPGLGRGNGQGGQKQVQVQSKSEVTVNVEGMDAETAKTTFTETLFGEFDTMLRGAVRDGETAIER